MKYGEVPKRNVLSEIWDRGIEEYFQFMDETQSLFFEGLCDTGQSTVSISIIKVKQWILHRTRVAACSEIKSQHIKTICGQNAEFLNFEPLGI